jgi:hypothetical protein
MLKARALALLAIFPSLASKDGEIYTVIIFILYGDCLMHRLEVSSHGTNIKRDLNIVEGHEWS